jgi:hypothetical protein
MAFVESTDGGGFLPAGDALSVLPFKADAGRGMVCAKLSVFTRIPV